MPAEGQGLRGRRCAPAGGWAYSERDEARAVRPRRPAVAGGGRVRCRSGSTAEAAGPRPLETGSEAPAAPSPHRTVTPRAGGGASPAR